MRSPIEMMRQTAVFFILSFTACTGNGVADAGFVVSWNIEDPNGDSLTCAMIGADHVVIDVKDSEGTVHEFAAMCDDKRFETTEWDVATGKGSVTASTVMESGIPIAKIEPLSFEFISGKNGNVLPDLVFIVENDVLAAMGPRFDLTVQLQDSTGQAASCEKLGTGFLSFTLTDSMARMHELGSVPCQSIVQFSTTLSSVSAEGKAELEIAFRNAEFVRISQQVAEVEIALSDVSLGPIVLNVTPRAVGGNAGISWKWTDTGEFLDQDDCARLGIDYAALYVWDEEFGAWWTDPVQLVAPCDAFDHPGDETVFGEDIYSGLFVQSFLNTGDYRLFLGFFRAAQSEQEASGADVLVQYDMISNAELEVGTNLFVLDLSAADPSSGVIKVHPVWENEETGTFNICADAETTQIGYVLLNEKGLATSSKLSETYPCADEIVFLDLPQMTTPYTLAIYGLNADGAMRWFETCGELLPEATIDAAAAHGYQCRVSHLVTADTN